MTLQWMTIRAALGQGYAMGLGFALGLAFGFALFSNGLSAAPLQDLQHTLYLATKDGRVTILLRGVDEARLL
jgi:hypothetical protein